MADTVTSIFFFPGMPGTDFLVSETRHCPLDCLSLFFLLDRCDAHGASGFIPMTLPLGADDPCLGHACSSASGGGVADDNECLHPLREAFASNLSSVFLASTDGRSEQLDGTGIWLPPGFPHGASHVVSASDHVDRQLLTPLTRPFSTSRRFNNMLSRSAVTEDILPLFAILRHACNKNGSKCSLDEGTDVSSLTVPALFGALVDLMSEVVQGCAEFPPSAGESGKIDGFEGLFRLISTQMFPDAAFEDHLTASHIRLLSSSAVGTTRRESAYWLALNQLLPLATPVFLSPVGSPTAWLSLILHNGSLTVGSNPPVDGVPPLSSIGISYAVDPSAASETSIGAVVVVHSASCDWSPPSGPGHHDGIDCTSCRNARRIQADDDGSVSSDEGGSYSTSSSADAVYERTMSSLMDKRDLSLQHCVRELCRRSLSNPDSVAGLSSRSVGAQW